MDETIKKLEQQDKKLDAIYASAEKTRKYLLWTLTITVAVIVVPLIGLPFAIPEAIRRRDDQGETVREIARSYNVSHSTISRLVA